MFNELKWRQIRASTVFQKLTFEMECREFKAFLSLDYVTFFENIYIFKKSLKFFVFNPDTIWNENHVSEINDMQKYYFRKTIITK